MIVLIALTAIQLLSARGVTAEQQAPIRVVTTLSTFADLVSTIGGERVQVKSVASARFNPHFIEPRPSDVLALKRAELFVHGGLDLEAWRGPLVDAAGNTRVRPGGDRALDLSLGIPLLEVPTSPVSRAEGDIHLFGNPHYWLDPRNGLIMAKAIAAKLIEIDPKSSIYYQERADSFASKLNLQIGESIKEIQPAAGRGLIGYHNEWIYLVNFLGLTMDHFLEPKPGIQPSGQHLDALVSYAQSAHPGAIIQSSYFSPEAANSLSKKTGIPVVILCQSVGELPDCGDYLSFTAFNVHQLAKVLNTK